MSMQIGCLGVGTPQDVLAQLRLRRIHQPERKPNRKAARNTVGMPSVSDDLALGRPIPSDPLPYQLPGIFKKIRSFPVESLAGQVEQIFLVVQMKAPKVRSGRNVFQPPVEGSRKN